MEVRNRRSVRSSCSIIWSIRIDGHRRGRPGGNRNEWQPPPPALAKAAPLTYVIDANGSNDPSNNRFADIQSALDAIPDNAGDVIFELASDIKPPSKASAFDIPSEKGITSFTICSSVENGATIGESYGSSIALYANGVPTTLGPNITFKGSVYGGANGGALERDTSIAIEEQSTAINVFGGSLNGGVVGDTSIIVKGTVSGTLAGGGQAKVDSSNPDVVADVDGSTSIIIEATGIATYVHGGGRAALSSGSNATSAQANVSGSAMLRIAGATEQTNGGGFAGPESYAYPTQNAQATANLGGDASIVFEATAKSSEDDWMNQVFGGGWAQGTSSETNSVTADVAGSTSIEALFDDTAASSQPKIKAFNALYGGGYALYRNAQANVGNNTSVKTARPNWESREGIAGGGYASWGATANVGGQAHVEVFAIEGQQQSYQNANLVVGGGIALCGLNGGSTTNAQAGSTSVVIHEGANLTSGSYAGANVIGGGLALSSNTNVDVAGATFITVEDGVALAKEIVGGGVAFPEGNSGGFKESNSASANAGDTHITLGSNCTVGQNVVGGGRIMKAPRVSASVNSTSIEVGENSTIKGALIGGGFIFGSDAVDSAAQVAKTSATVVGDGCAIEGKLYVGDGTAFSSTYFVGGGCIAWSASSCNVDVKGSATTTFGNNVTCNSLIGGGMLYQAVNGSASCGSAATTIGSGYHNANKEQWTTAAGRTISSTGSARVGSPDLDLNAKAVSFEAGSGFSSYLFAGGGIASGAKTAGDSDARVIGDISISFKSGTIDWFYGGACLGGTLDTADIAGSISTTLNETTISTKFIPSGLGPVQNNVSTTLRDLTMSPSVPVKAEASGNVAGNQTFKLVGSVTLTGEYLYTAHASGTVLVQIGDESGVPTSVSTNGIYAPSVSEDHPTNIAILKNARLNLIYTGSDTPYYLMGASNVDVAEGGVLAVTSSTAPATLAGDLTGGGTVALPAGGSIAGAGALDGNLTLEVAGELADGQTYFDFSDASTGSVAFADPNDKFVLVTDAQTAGHQKWLLREQFTVSFDVQGGPAIEAQKVVSSEKAARPDDPAREGYVFAGWYANADFSGDAWDFDANPVTADVTLYAKWDDGIKVTVAAGDNGSIDPADAELVFTGTPLKLHITPDYGYKIDSVTVNGAPAAFDKTGLREGVLTLSPTEATAVEVTFALLDKDAADEIIDSLPTIDPDTDEPEVVEQKKDAILDAKLDFESMTPEEKRAVSQDAVDKLNEAVVQVPEVEIKVELKIDAEVDANVAIADGQESRFMGAVGKDEVEALKKGDASLLKVLVQIQSVDAPSEDAEREALEGALGANQAGQHFAASVTKELSDGTTTIKTEPITALPAPVQLRFDVPQALLNVDAGTTRTFAMARTHHNGTQWEAQLLDDEDGNKSNETILISTDRFSTYSIVYADTHTVTFASNGGSAVDSQAIVHGATAQEPAAPTRDGFTFEGWFVDAACTSAFDFGTPVTAPLALYAKWSTAAPPQPIEHAVTFEANGGSTVAPLTVIDGAKITAPAAPKKDGCTFDGWYVDQGLTTPWNFEADTVTGDVTLYAKWLEIADPQPNQFEVVFVTGDGSSKVPTQLVNKGDAASEPAAPAREGFEFGGWYTDDTFARAWDFSAPVTAPLTLYAKWTEVAPPVPVTYYVTFESNGGSPAPAAQEVVEGGFATKPAVDPSRDGYTFDGWFADAALTLPYSFDTPVTENLVLFAKWTKQQVPQPPAGDGPSGPTGDKPSGGLANGAQQAEHPAATEGGAKGSELAPTGDNADALAGIVTLSLGLAAAIAALASRMMRTRQPEA